MKHKNFIWGVCLGGFLLVGGICLRGFCPGTLLTVFKSLVWLWYLTEIFYVLLLLTVIEGWIWLWYWAEIFCVLFWPSLKVEHGCGIELKSSMCCFDSLWKLDMVVVLSWNLLCTDFDSPWKLNLVVILSWNLQCGVLTVFEVWDGCGIELKSSMRCFDCPWRLNIVVVLIWNLPCTTFDCSWKLDFAMI